MKEINIIGMGMSDKTLTPEALELIKGSDILIGAKRLINDVSYLNKPSFNAYLSNDILEIIEKTDSEKIAILVSGDVGFYSAAEKLVDVLEDYEPNLVSGISSVSYFFAKCGLPWKDAALISCHGINTNIVSAVRRNRYTFALTGKNIPDFSKQVDSRHLHIFVETHCGTDGGHLSGKGIFRKDMSGEFKRIFFAPAADLSGKCIGKKFGCQIEKLPAELT